MSAAASSPSLALLLVVLAVLPGSDTPALARFAIPVACALAALALRRELRPPRALDPLLRGHARHPAGLGEPAALGSLRGALGRAAVRLARPLRRLLLPDPPRRVPARPDERRLPGRADRGRLRGCPGRRRELDHAGGRDRPGGGRAACGARRRDPARAQPGRGGAQRSAHPAEEPPGARPGGLRAAGGGTPWRRPADRGGGRPGSLQVGQRPARAPSGGPRARARRAHPGLPPPRGRHRGTYRRGGIHAAAPELLGARCLPCRRAPSDRCRQRVRVGPGAAHVQLRCRHLPRSRRDGGRRDRVGRPGPVRGQGARAQPLDHLQPRDLRDLRPRGRWPRPGRLAPAHAAHADRGAGHPRRGHGEPLAGRSGDIAP